MPPAISHLPQQPAAENISVLIGIRWHSEGTDRKRATRFRLRRIQTHISCHFRHGTSYRPILFVQRHAVARLGSAGYRANRTRTPIANSAPRSVRAVDLRRGRVRDSHARHWFRPHIVPTCGAVGVVADRAGDNRFGFSVFVAVTSVPTVIYPSVRRLRTAGELQYPSTSLDQTTNAHCSCGVRVSMLRPRLMWSSISAAAPIIRP